MKTQETPAVIVSPSELLKLAIDKDLDIEKLEKLVAMQERFNEKQAQKAFLIALSEFQDKCPVMKKTKLVSFISQRTQRKTEYNYAPLSEIVKTIKTQMKANGLSYRWEADTLTPGKIGMTCIASHIDGHSERNRMEADKDDSGGKNAIQQQGSAMTYLQRYTIIGVFGISTADEDIDGIQKKVKVSKAVSKDMLNKAKIVMDEYEDRQVLKKNSGAFIQSQQDVGMHILDLAELVKHVNKRFVDLGKKNLKSKITLP